MKRYLFILCLSALALCGCSDDKHELPNPSMKLIVADESGNKLKGAVVILYDDYHDWFDVDDPVRAGITDENGEVLFEDMDEIVYFFDVTYDDNYWNYPEGVYRTENPLQRGYCKTIAVTLYESDDDISKK